MINDSQVDNFLKPKKKETFCRVFCACKCKENFNSIYTRRESALFPLDGLRANAMLWVCYIHFGFSWQPYLRECISVYNPITRIISTGDAGVDVFFTLSGFLIAYILLKECDKYDGNVDYFNFMRGRFLRIWPAMALCGMFFAPVHKWYTLLNWVFLQNTLLMPNKHISHFWSIAVEMQMYLFSPWLMMKFYSAKNEKMVMMVPIVICLISTIINIIVTAETMPEYFDTGDFHSITKEQEMDHFRNTYMPFYTRMSPYGFGMYAAYQHLAEVKRNKKSANHEDVSYILSWKCLILEFLSFAIALTCIYIGFIPKLMVPEVADKPAGVFMLVFGRQLFTLPLSYLIYIMVSPNTNLLHQLRPVTLLRKFLSSSVWLPLATISYSMYLYHIFFVFLIFYNLWVYPDWTPEAPMPGLMKNVETYKGCPFSTSGAYTRLAYIMIAGLIPSVLISIVSYLLVEKPGIDARRVFKNKYDKTLPE